MPSRDDTTSRRPLALWTWIELTLLAVGAAQSTRILLRAFEDRESLTGSYGSVIPVAFAIAAIAIVLMITALAVAVQRLRRDGTRVTSGRMRAFLYVLFIAWAAFLFAGKFEKYRFDFLVVVIVGGWSVVCLAGTAIARAIPTPARQAADVVLMNLAIFALLLELLLSGLGKLSPSPLLSLEQTPRSLLSAYQFQPGHIHGGFPVNDHGFYDEPLVPIEEGLTRVVCIGDSFSTGAVPHYFHYTTVCERQLENVVVDNVGVNNIGPPTYRHLLETVVLAVDPDVVVVSIFVGNDITDANRNDMHVPLKYRLFDREQLHVWKIPQRLLAMRHAGAEIVTEKLTIDPKSALAARPWINNPLLEKPTFAEDSYFDLETTRARFICLPHEARYERFFRSLDELVTTVGDIPLLFMLIPDEFQVEDWLWQVVLERAGGNAGLDRELPQRRIRAWCEERGVEYLDLLPDLRALPPLENGRIHAYHLYDTHFNARGNRVAGEALARRLRDVLEAIPKTEG